MNRRGYATKAVWGVWIYNLTVLGVWILLRALHPVSSIDLGDNSGLHKVILFNLDKAEAHDLADTVHLWSKRFKLPLGALVLVFGEKLTPTQWVKEEYIIHYFEDLLYLAWVKNWPIFLFD